MTVREKESPNHRDTSRAFVPDPSDDRETTRIKLDHYLTSVKLDKIKAELGYGASSSTAADSYHYSVDSGLPACAIALPEDVDKAVDRAQMLEAESGRRMLAMLKGAFGKGRDEVYRPLACALDPGFLSVLDDEFPLFKEVTGSAVDQLSLYWKLKERTKEEQPVSLRPMLICGKPGYGKTAYMRALASLLGVPFEEIQIGSTSAGFVITGTDPAWSSSKPGRVFEAVVRGKVANPMILLDELDKLSGDPRYRPDGALYSLLERDSATRFTDEYLGFPFDASHVIWAATANDISRIPEPILSRLDVFHIPDPTEEQARATALSVYRKVLASEPWGVLFPDEPKPDVISIMAEVSPRVASLGIVKALGRACKEGRDYVTPDDFEKKASPKMRVGFL